MAELHNVRNTGIIVGGDVTRSKVSVSHTGAASGETDEAEVLRRLDTLFTDLLAGIGQLPAEQAGEAARETVRLKAEITAASRDSKRVRGVLGNLTTAVAAAAPLVEIVKDITDLVTSLLH
jgi:hypothetical protein